MQKSQVGMEYIIIMGFIVFVVITILGIALFYSSNVKDRIKILDINNCANKIISSAESVFYSGYPSRITIFCYLPDNVKSIQIEENSLFIEYQTQSGISKTSFSSKVPISGSLAVFSGLRKVKITAEQNYASISLA